MVSVCAYLQHLILKVAAAVLNMDCTAAVDKERRSLSASRTLCINRDGSGILDVDLRVLSYRRDARCADIRHRLDREVFAVQIDIQSLSSIGT